MNGTITSLSGPLRVTGGATLLLLETLVALLRRPPRPREVLRQVYEIANGSLLFIVATMGFLGLISVYQGSIQVTKVLPDLSLVGAAFIQGTVKEFGPTIVALMLATKVGSGIAAQLGTMKVTEQTEALAMCNTSAVEYVLAPRFAGSIVAVPVLTIVGSAVSVAAGWAMAHLRFHMSTATFFSTRLTSFQDLHLGLTKLLVYSVVVPVVAAEAGLRARGGAEGVGNATTEAVVNCSFAIILLDFVISWTWRVL